MMKSSCSTSTSTSTSTSSLKNKRRSSISIIQTTCSTCISCMSFLTIILFIQSTQKIYSSDAYAFVVSTSKSSHPLSSTATQHKNTPFIILSHHYHQNTKLNLRAPPGSGYYTDEDEPSYFPETYEPMMEYPGTMRPGRTPENQPYSSLPIQESDPDPVPWPHFQEVEWHHNWGSPHEAPIPMEEYIELHDRWASAEVEAEMRAGARRGVRERRELEEAQKAASFILDDDEEDDEGGDGNGSGVPRLELGEGVDALIGAGVQAAASVSKPGKIVAVDDDDDDGDNFLLDLGLDEVDDSDDEEEDDDGDEPAFATDDDGTGGLVEALQSMIDAEDDSGAGVAGGSDDDNEIDIDFDDLGLNFDDDDDSDDDMEDIDDDDDDDDDDDSGDDEYVMDDDDISMDGDDLTLDEMIGNEDMGADDEFDDGGFDYD